MGQNWGGQCESGQFQSPININTTDIENSTDYYSIKFNYHDWQVVKVNNNEKNYWQFLSPVDDKGTLTLSVNIDRLGQSECKEAVYNLINIHFHTKSEHTVDQKQYELEVHLQHVITLESKSCSNFKNNLQISLLYESGILDFEENIFLFQLNLGQYADQHSKRQDTGVATELRELSDPYYPAQVSGKALLKRYIPEIFMKNGFYLYDGSRTQPDCVEDYIWIISPEIFKIPRAQYLIFKDNMNNPSFRGIQPLNNRTVHFSSSVTSGSVWGLSMSLVSILSLSFLLVTV